jgi:hypothetical protein
VDLNIFAKIQDFIGFSKKIQIGNYSPKLPPKLGSVAGFKTYSRLNF